MNKFEKIFVVIDFLFILMVVITIISFIKNWKGTISIIYSIIILFLYYKMRKIVWNSLEEKEELWKVENEM